MNPIFIIFAILSAGGWAASLFKKWWLARDFWATAIWLGMAFMAWQMLFGGRKRAE